MFSKEYSNKDIDEQLSYMEDFYSLLHLKERDNEDPGSVIPEKIRELEERKRNFEDRLKENPDRYPIGAFFRKHRLNALERYMVTAVASTILYSMESRWPGSEADLRRFARLYHDSPRKRLEAEFYFTHDCKLLESGIMSRYKGESGKPGRQATASVKLDLHSGAYRAIMGRSEPVKEEVPEDRPSKRMRRVSDVERDNGEPLGEIMEPRLGLDRVILASETMEEIRSAIILEQNRGVLFDYWGLGDQLIRGRGVSMLFAGPPGTGKTLAAEAVAHELGRKLLCISGADLVSKYHGEEEHHNAKMFKRAKEEGAVLFFDEADSFFFARHDVHHCTDVADNRIINIILTCLENHTLPVILTTNRADALDPALERRLTLKVVFGMPGREERELIWRLHLPANLPIARDVDIRELAERHELAGGHIKNAVMAAARRAIARVSDVTKAQITMQDLERSCREETQSVVLLGGQHGKVGFMAS